MIQQTNQSNHSNTDQSPPKLLRQNSQKADRGNAPKLNKVVKKLFSPVLIDLRVDGPMTSNLSLRIERKWFKIEISDDIYGKPIS